MRYKLAGGGNVSLSKREFVGAGGEGSVYVKGANAYKIYADPSRMIPEGKIRELSSISDSKVIKPIDVLLGKNNRPVGYSMGFVKDAIPICQLFTKAYKKRNGIGTSDVVDIVKCMQSSLVDIHSAGVLVVDLNEMNLLVRSGDVFWIDVDSYQTRSYPATAIMDSVRDWKANGRWSKETDWFSWGIVTFQLFAGIHPFKGKHPNVKKMSDRMLNGISVFNADVSVPKMVPSFDLIPKEYRDWYRAVFEDGKRCPPPSVIEKLAVQIVPRRISSTDLIEIFELAEFDSDVALVDSIGAFEMVATEGGFSKSRSWKGGQVEADTPQFFAATTKGVPILGAVDRGRVQLRDSASGAEIGEPWAARGAMVYEGRIYSQMGENIVEAEVREVGNGKHLVSQRVVANVMPEATQIFDGVVIQNMLGSWYASVFPESGKNYQVWLEDLDGYRLVDAKHDRGVLIVIGEKLGKYDKFVYRFERGYVRAIMFWKDADISYQGINFVTLEKGVCAHIDENEDLVLFGSRPGYGDVKKIQDPVLGGDMRLFKKNDDVLFAKGNKVFRLSMRKK